MPRTAKNKTRKVEQYAHPDKTRLNNPPAGLVTPKTDPDAGKKKTWAYDPHIDPALHWAGKAERTSFEVPTVSLHVHERIDPHTIIEAVRERKGNGADAQISLFESERQKPLREAIDFYRHSHQWSNRLVAGDSLLVMNSLLEKEGMAGKVQCVYMDPPYGIKYGSNFQPFVGKRDVKDGKDDDLTAEPEMIKAFRDTWELGIHSYLSYMRDRLLLARELLTESGSCFVQIGDENLHLIRNLMSEVFGNDNHVSTITYKTSVGLAAKYLDAVSNYIIWFSKDKERIKYRSLYKKLRLGEPGATRYVFAENTQGKTRRLSPEEQRDASLIPSGWKAFFRQGLTSRSGSKTTAFSVDFEGNAYKPSAGGWRTGKEGMQRLIKTNRVVVEGNRLTFKKFFDDFGALAITNFWDDVSGGVQSRSDPKIYVVQTATKVIQRCLLMTTDPGDLVFDPTCGSGTTAYTAEQWGRRWITCDTSRVALTLAKQRLMTANFDYYQLAHPDEGVGSGFKYKTVPHVTLKSIANNEPAATETLYDQPFKDTKKARVTGPFTVEAVPAPMVLSIAQAAAPPGEGREAAPADASVARSGETLRQDEWRDELLKTGIRGKAGQRISFSRMEPLPCRWLHADAETKPNDFGPDHIAGGPSAEPQRAVISFGPAHAPLEQKQVELALQEAGHLKPTPSIVVFAAFQFDPEAAKDIDETDWPGVTMLKVQMNADLETADLKKKRAGNESFWLIGQPDVSLRQIRKGDHTGKWQVEVHGFDYFNTRTGELESGGDNRIAIWMLDTNYDGRSLYPSQVFFPMSGEKDGWSKLAKNLKAEIDEDMIEAYRGAVSLPFEMGDKERVAVKIVDDRGVESLRIVEAK